MHHDTNMQGLLALDGTSMDDDSTLHLARRPLNIPHWMSSKQVHHKDTSPHSGLAEKSFPSNVQTKPGSVSSFPSSKLKFGSDRRTYSNLASETWIPDARFRPKAQELPPAGPPPFKRDVHEEECKISREDWSSSFLHRQGKRSAKGCIVDLPTLSVGHSNGDERHQRVDESSWVSKFPLQIEMNSELPEHGQLTHSREAFGHNLLIHPNNKGHNQGACKGVAEFSSQLITSKGHIDHHKSLPEYSQPLAPAGNGVLAKKTGSNLSTPWPSPPKDLVLNVPSRKWDMNATLVEGVKHAQLLPHPSFQPTGASNAESRNKNIAIDDSSGSRPDEIKNGLSFPSLPSGLCTSSIDAMTRKERKLNNGQEALKAMSPLSEQDIHKSLRQVALIGVKHEILPEDSRTRDSTVEHGKIASSQGRVLTEACSFSTEHTVNQVIRESASIISFRDGVVAYSQAAELVLFRDAASTEESTAVSTGFSSLPPLKYSQNFLTLEDGNAHANKNDLLQKDWGAFLAAPRSIGKASENDGKLMLPFQQRFEQLQKFLKQCDGSERDYCMRALWSLSGRERSNQSAELQSRAARLSLEEGKEIKRAKLLNMLDDSSDRPLVDACARPIAPSFSASTKTAAVEEG